MSRRSSLMSKVPPEAPPSPQIEPVDSENDASPVYSRLFPTFNFISFPENSSANSDAQSEVSNTNNSLGSIDSEVLRKMADQLFDTDQNIRQSLQNITLNKTFYSHYYEELAPRRNANEEDDDDFQRYISDFNRERRIEAGLKAVLDEKRVKSSNLVNVFNDENYLSDNFYVSDKSTELATGFNGPRSGAASVVKTITPRFSLQKLRGPGFLKSRGTSGLTTPTTPITPMTVRNPFPEASGSASVISEPWAVDESDNVFQTNSKGSKNSKGPSGSLKSSSSYIQASISAGSTPTSPSSTSPEEEKEYGQLQRKLTQRHLQMIALSGTLGVGLYLSSSKNFSLSGPFGALLGFVIAGSIVLATMLSLCEMITFIPLVGGVSGIGTRFVDDALGFAAGFVYWVNYAVSLPSEITAGTIMLSYYDNINLPGKSAAGWISFFLAWIVGVNLVDVRVYGELEFFLSAVKLAVIIISTILNIIINTGGMAPVHDKIGFRYWQSSQSNVSAGLTYGLFRPTFDLTDIGDGSTHGISGGTGRFLSILISTCIASYAYMGTEIVVIVAGEAKNPRKALPSATNRIFWRILLFYIIAIFCVSLNFYSGDPRLFRYRLISPKDPANAKRISEDVLKLFGSDFCTSERSRNRIKSYTGFYNGNQSPWIIAFQNARLCGLSSVFNGIFVVFALSAGSSQLYASSRTLYQLSLQGKAPQIFSKCSNQGVPYVSVLFSGMFGCLAYLCVNNDSNNVFQRLMTICTTSGEIVWACMCLSFIRYYYGLKQRTDLISRDSPAFPYKGPFQPYLAYYGMFAGMVVILSTGITVFLKDMWSTEFFFTSYGSLMLFFISYFGYKFVKGTKILTVDKISLDIGRKENDKVMWEEKTVYKGNIKERLKKLMKYLF